MKSEAQKELRLRTFNLRQVFIRSSEIKENCTSCRVVLDTKTMLQEEVELSSQAGFLQPAEETQKIASSLLLQSRVPAVRQTEIMFIAE